MELNPQNKLIQQSQARRAEAAHRSQGLNEPQPVGQLDTNIPVQPPTPGPIPQQGLSDTQRQQAHEQQQQDRQGFKGLLQAAKQRAINGGKQQLRARVADGQSEKPQSEIPAQGAPNPQRAATPTGQPPTPTPPPPTRPSAQPPAPQPPKPKLAAPRFRAPKPPKFN